MCMCACVEGGGGEAKNTCPFGDGEKETSLQKL